MPLKKIKSSLKDKNIQKTDLVILINEFDHFEIARRLNELITEDKVRVSICLIVIANVMLYFMRRIWTVEWKSKKLWIKNI